MPNRNEEIESKPRSKPVERPSGFWAMAMSHLVKLECSSITTFFWEADGHFSAELNSIARAADGANVSDAEIDTYVDLRDEFEDLKQTNRYFALVQAARVFERVSNRIIERAVAAKLLSRKSMYGRSKYILPRSIELGYKTLGIVLPDEDASQIKALVKKRHLILHAAGRLPETKQSDNKFRAVGFIEVSNTDVISAVQLACRCTQHRIAEFRRLHCEEMLTRQQINARKWLD